MGIQAVIQMISGGILFDTAVIIIFLVLLGVAATGALQVMQIYMVEILQRRLFAKASFEFAYRLPKIKTDNLASSYAPEVVNRFFDVIILQKGVSKILVDLTTVILQVFFGLLLLAFYHYSFIVFDVVLITVAFLVFKYTGKKGLESSIRESSYKYKMVSWLQEIGRNLPTFKMAGTKSNIVLEKTDTFTSKYLTSRKVHFRVLLTQYINILFFKLSIIAATLILGSFLIVDRQINLGQFVAIEIVIVSILSAVEKIIISVDTVYDTFTAVEKIAKISDYPLEASGNIVADDYTTSDGFTVTLKEVSYTSVLGTPILHNVSITLPAGKVVALAGKNSYAKDAIINIISGIYQNYTGLAEINGISIKNLEVDSLRGKVAHNFSNCTLFEGTILDNITLGNIDIKEIDVIDMLTKLGVYEYISKMPYNLQTKIQPGGLGLPTEVSEKVCLSKNLIRKPKLWVVDSYSYKSVTQALKLYEKQIPTPTILVVGNNTEIHKVAHSVYVVDNGAIILHGPYNTIENNSLYQYLIEKNDA
ncbi:MAG: ABC transporter ATP-binding protein/permease [Sphingobacteriales bacterium JAD_PAG50586_3]|nr:MAG: ABC transporter ATP-binding protein/permease [Sphingobacteriales bacterium JAD_PAG50586_3]